MNDNDTTAPPVGTGEALTHAERHAHAFLGSAALMDALGAAAVDHTSFVEVPDDLPPYIWCACGWRSDDLPRERGDEQRAFIVHLTNVLHEASVKALQPMVLRITDVERILADRRAAEGDRGGER